MDHGLAFDTALAEKGLVLDPKDHAAALVVFTFLARCSALLKPGNASR